MAHAKILLCLDSDRQVSVFDSVVAIDAGVNHLLRHRGVEPDDVRNLVYGAIFTRGPEDLKNTAIFVGGSDVAAGEKLLEEAQNSFFGPMRVSLMLDSNGANTTAAAAVLAASKHLSLEGTSAAVLGATGSVGRRVVRLLAREGATVRVASRKIDRAEEVCNDVRGKNPRAEVSPVATSDEASLTSAIEGAALVIASGAPGVELLAEKVWQAERELKMMIDLNAVPPTGIENVDPQDKATEREGRICYGAIGIGTTKMKLHKAALGQLFEANDRVLDAEEIYEIGKAIS